MPGDAGELASWFNLIRRVRDKVMSVWGAYTCEERGVALTEIRVICGKDGSPVAWTVECKAIEPRRGADALVEHIAEMQEAEARELVRAMK